MATTDNVPFHHESQHDPDRCEAIIPGTNPIPVEQYQSNRCDQKKGHTSVHGADFRFWRDESNPKSEPEPGWPDEHMLEAAWGLIANASGGSWDEASPKWREAAKRWRDAYHDGLRKEN